MEEGLQLLMRLPGLATPEFAPGSTSESRIFIDESISESAYGEDLAKYIAVPFGNHPLNESVSWSTTCSELACGVAAAALLADGF